VFAFSLVFLPHNALATGAVTVTPVSIASNNASTTLAKTGDRVTVSFTSNQAALIVPTGTINGHAATVLATTATSSATSWTAYAATQTGDTEGNVTFSFLVGNSDGTATSSAVTLITAGSNVRFDKTAPTVAPITIASNNTGSTALAASGNLVTLSFTTSEGLSVNPSITIGAHSASVVNVSASTTWTASATVTGSDADGDLTFTITTPADYAGNATTSATWITSGSRVTVDETAPVITPTSATDSYFASTNIYSDPGAAAVDAHDGATAVISSGSVNLLTAGTYTISYSSTDTAGNSSSASRTVIVSISGGGGIAGGGGGGGGSTPTALPNNGGNAAAGTSASGGTGSSSLASLQTQVAALLAQLAALQGGTSAPASFTRDLTIGSTGSDVTAIQIWLNGHGFVLVSSGAGSPGNETSRFGALTRSALAKWQASVGISPAAGYFGAKTRAYLATH
jgi:hypothetical protein